MYYPSYHHCWHGYFRLCSVRSTSGSCCDSGMQGMQRLLLMSYVRVLVLCI